MVHQDMQIFMGTKHREPDADDRGGRRDYDTDDPRPRRHHGSYDEGTRTPPRHHGTHDVPMKPTPHKRPGC